MLSPVSFLWYPVNVLMGLVVLVSGKRDELFFTLLPSGGMLPSRETYIQYLTATCAVGLGPCSSLLAIGWKLCVHYFKMNLPCSFQVTWWASHRQGKGMLPFPLLIVLFPFIMVCIRWSRRRKGLVSYNCSSSLPQIKTLENRPELCSN